MTDELQTYLVYHSTDTLSPSSRAIDVSAHDHPGTSPFVIEIPA